MVVHIRLHKRYERMQLFSIPHLFVKANALGEEKRIFDPLQILRYCIYDE